MAPCSLIAERDMMRRTSTILLTAICVLANGLAASPVVAEDDDAVAAVRAAAAAYLDALNRGDESAIIASWTDDGVYIDASGRSRRARDIAHEEFAAATPKQGDQALSPPASTIHFVGPTVAIEQSTASVGPSANASPAEVNFVAAWVKQNDRWQLSLLREFPPPSSTPAARGLDQLAWMVGNWTATQDRTVVELTGEWTPDKTYIIQRFVAKRDDSVVRRGAQRIAWDAAANRIRSWTFNADGGFGESQWRQEGDVWIAESTGVLADGGKTKSFHFWTPEGEDSCWFKSLHGEIDGQPTEDLTLKFSRREAP
jgi:uncharacterized protein (TIGR02246 family)